jgi:hypothetical protein
MIVPFCAMTLRSGRYVEAQGRLLRKERERVERPTKSIEAQNFA